MNQSLQPIIDFCRNNIGFIEELRFAKGELIPFHKGDEHIFFVIAQGSVRLVDSARTFDSLTLSILLSPSLIGPSTSLCYLDYLNLRADSDVLLYSVDLYKLPSELTSLLLHYRRTYLCPSEWALIQRVLLENSSTSIYSSSLKNHPSSLWPQNLCSALSESNFSKIIYLDLDLSLIHI